MSLNGLCFETSVSVCQWHSFIYWINRSRRRLQISFMPSLFYFTSLLCPSSTLLCAHGCTRFWWPSIHPYHSQIPTTSSMLVHMELSKREETAWQRSRWVSVHTNMWWKKYMYLWTTSIHDGFASFNWVGSFLSCYWPIQFLWGHSEWQAHFVAHSLDAFM